MRDISIFFERFRQMMRDVDVADAHVLPVAGTTFTSSSAAISRRLLFRHAPGCRHHHNVTRLTRARRTDCPSPSHAIFIIRVPTA